MNFDLTKFDKHDQNRQPLIKIVFTKSLVAQSVASENRSSRAGHDNTTSFLRSSADMDPLALPLIDFQRPRMEAPIRLEKILQNKASQSNSRAGGHHHRQPDLSTSIRVYIPSSSGPDDEYAGEYRGHGHKKTVFELSGLPHPRRFDGAVLKVARQTDIEPSVFKQTSEYGITTPVLYECYGFDDRVKYHCWITDATIPLDEFVKFDVCDKPKCTLAACRCLLIAADRGLYLSDCHFFNFGVRVTSDATEHEVVILDAGSRGFHPEEVWSKKDLTKKCMHNFWKWSTNEGVRNTEVEQIYRGHNDLQQCIKDLNVKWSQSPILTTHPLTTESLRRELHSANDKALQRFVDSGAHRILQLVGRFACGDAWSDSLCTTCYRAAQSLKVTLQEDESAVLDELHSRVTNNRDEREVHDVIAFWWKLQEYREDWLSKQDGATEHDMVLNTAQVQKVLNNWEYYEMWWDLSWQQRREGHLPSIYNAALQNRAGWTCAAKAVIQYGVPQLRLHEVDGCMTEQINAVGEFANRVAKMLQNLAQGIVYHRSTESYKKAREASNTSIATWGLTYEGQSRRHLLSRESEKRARH